MFEWYCSTLCNQSRDLSIETFHYPPFHNLLYLHYLRVHCKNQAFLHDSFFSLKVPWFFCHTSCFSRHSPVSTAFQYIYIEYFYKTLNKLYILYMTLGEPYDAIWILPNSSARERAVPKYFSCSAHSSFSGCSKTIKQMLEKAFVFSASKCITTEDEGILVVYLTIIVRAAMNHLRTIWYN